MKSSTPLVVFVTLVLVALGVLVYVTQDRMTPGTTGPEAGGPPATQVAVDAGEAVPASPPAAEQGEAKPADEAAGEAEAKPADEAAGEAPATDTAADSDAAQGEEAAQDGTADAAAESGQQTAESVPATADDEEPQVQAEDTAPAATDAPVGDETAQAAAEEAAKAEDAPEPADQAADTEPAASSEAADTETAATAEESGADRAAAEEQSGTEPATEQADAASEPDGDSGTQETDVALADPTQQVEETEEPSEAAPLTEPAPRQPRLVTPTFDIVRVEPDGTAVVAGRATVGATVSVLLDGQPIGTAETNERGEWVVVIDEPIAAGSHELSISSDLDGEIMRSEQSVAVVVPETGEERPLIVLSEPGQPSTVLQAPAKTEAPSGPVEVTLDTVDYDDSGEIVFAGRAAPGATLRIYVDNQPLADVRADASGHWQHVASGAVSPGNHSLRIDRIDGTGAVVARVELPFMRAEPRDVAALNAERAAQQAGSQPEAEAGSEPQPDGDTAGTAGAQPSQEELARRYAAAEPAGDDAATATEPAGAEPDGETAAAPAEPAREPGDSAPQPSQEELARKYAATPPAEEPSADASQPEERETDVAVATPPVEDETAGEPAGEAVDEPAAEIPAAREAPAAPQPSQEELARKYAAAPPAGDGQEPAARPAPASDDAMQEAAEPGDAPTGADVAEDEAPATEREVAAADPEADVETQPTAGRIVVQPGNNLWRISRVIYGKGVRYTIIYSANADQIRDPNLIYPGQIFVTPGIVPPEVIEPEQREPLVDAEPEIPEEYVTEYERMHRELMRRR